MEQYKLSEKEAKFVAECLTQRTQIEQRLNGALAMICAQNGLPGPWRLQPNGLGMEPVPPEPQPLPIQTQEPSANPAA